ncbi:MAG: hypothetical protein U0905_12650 [Pirellulales bacterium]
MQTIAALQLADAKSLQAAVALHLHQAADAKSLLLAAIAAILAAEAAEANSAIFWHASRQSELAALQYALQHADAKSLLLAAAAATKLARDEMMGRTGPALDAGLVVPLPKRPSHYQRVINDPIPA